METVAVELPDKVIEAARARAAARNCTLEAYLRRVIERSLAGSDTDEDHLLGLFRDEPALADEVVEMAMRAREERGQHPAHS